MKQRRKINKKKIKMTKVPVIPLPLEMTSVNRCRFLPSLLINYKIMRETDTFL